MRFDWKSGAIWALLVAVMGLTAIADPQTDQAYQRLRDRQAATTQQSAATTRPANITNGELAALRDEISALKIKYARLEIENELLKKQLKAAQASANPAVSSENMVDEIQAAIKDGRYVVGMTMAQVQQVMAGNKHSIVRRHIDEVLFDGHKVKTEEWVINSGLGKRLSFRNGTLVEVSNH